MSTQREQRLARAIENLSARDMYRFSQFVGSGCPSPREVEARLLAYAEQNCKDTKRE